MQVISSTAARQANHRKEMNNIGLLNLANAIFTEL